MGFMVYREVVLQVAQHREAGRPRPVIWPSTACQRPSWLGLCGGRGKEKKRRVEIGPQEGAEEMGRTSGNTPTQKRKQHLITLSFSLKKKSHFPRKKKNTSNTSTKENPIRTRPEPRPKKQPRRKTSADRFGRRPEGLDQGC